MSVFTVLVALFGIIGLLAAVERATRISKRSEAEQRARALAILNRATRHPRELDDADRRHHWM